MTPKLRKIFVTFEEPRTDLFIYLPGKLCDGHDTRCLHCVCILPGGGGGGGGGGETRHEKTST